jgi:ATP-dependent Lon protease
MRLKLRVTARGEDRYFQELARLDQTFAVALRRSDPDASKHGLEPHLIATTARVLEICHVGTQGSDVVLSGISRVHLLSYRHNGHHLIGQTRYLPDLQESVPSLLLEEAQALGSEFAGSLLHPSVHNVPNLPKEAETLSYWIAQHLAVGPSEQQELLELRTTSTRLSKEVSHMRVILDALRSQSSS